MMHSVYKQSELNITSSTVVSKVGRHPVWWHYRYIRFFTLSGSLPFVDKSKQPAIFRPINLFGSSQLQAGVKLFSVACDNYLITNVIKQIVSGEGFVQFLHQVFKNLVDTEGAPCFQDGARDSWKVRVILRDQVEAKNILSRFHINPASQKYKLV